ncbi:ABC transporter ATP-binding protein [Natrinema sp. H-ect4]|uniref:ABC transporter ATP-binding protein n=1 Tax=Natrinema sp. H-ect4 TaxID=3242699 RepID=UPI0035A932E0
MSDIVLEGVDKVYPGGVEAVTGASLVVKDGEFVTIVGPSGCGKTTTLRMIAGFEHPTHGRVGIGGDGMTDVPPDERNTGMVFQDFALFPHMTVGENIAYGLTIGGGWDEADAKNRVEEMLELVELPGFADRDPEQLSGGQQQRVALARALAPEPEVLLLDEPLASLDKKLRESMQVELRRIQERVGITTVLVTHNQKEALTMSDRIAVMNDGQFDQVGTPQEVYNRPETRFVADFVGTANIFDGTVVDQSPEKITVDCGAFEILATPHDGVTVGETVSVVVRPEHTRVETTTEAANVIEGNVEVSRFLGDHVECHISLPTGTEAVGIVTPDGPSPTTGSQVTVGIDAEDCLVVTD